MGLIGMLKRARTRSLSRRNTSNLNEESTDHQDFVKPCVIDEEEAVLPEMEEPGTPPTLVNESEREEINYSVESIQESTPVVPEVKEPEPLPVKGAYLTFDPVSSGTLFISWSKEPVPGALAFFAPKKTVPEFKYKTNGGKSEIMRNLMGQKLKYYEGWCQFFKSAVEYEGDCVMFPSAEESALPLQIGFLCGSTVRTVNTDGKTVVSAKDTSIIGCVPRANAAFEIKILQKEMFLRNSRNGGVAIVLNE